jgi:hypothetical protein
LQKIHFKESKAINIEKWNTLLTINNAHVFNSTHYIDKITENWGAYIKGNYEGALLIAFRKKLGITWCYLPPFYRASEWIGSWTNKEKEDVLKQLKRDFKKGHFATHEVRANSTHFYHQQIEPNTNYVEQYNKLTKRMLKKAQNSELIETNDFHKTDFIQLIVNELKEKNVHWDKNEISCFEQLIDTLEKGDLLNYTGVVLKGKLVGGLLSIPFNNRVLYLKGTATLEAKKLGAMYYLMDNAISSAMKKNCTFDFGGSRIEGVAQFNHHFGGEDAYYTYFEWDNTPTWFQLIKKIRDKWKNK